MDMARRHLRRGFTGIEILIVLVIVGMISAAFPGCNQEPSGGPEDRAPREVPRKTQEMEDAARTGTAVMRMARMAQDAGGEAPAVDAPAVGPSDGDPGVGDILIELLQDVFVL